MGHIFVMVLIVGVFTIVPHEVNKLNNLAKQSYEWDKDYYPKHNSSGHVIVSGYALTTDAALDFLQEFYHTSRGTINLDVVFLSDSFPAADLVRALSMEKYRQRTCYLRGSLANSQDQSRAQMENATAVFLISNKSHHQDSKHHDAVTILHTLSVRNFSDSHGNHLDIYVQLSSREEEFETTADFLGAITTRTSALKSMILARSALCPGASTLILNLLHSPDIAEYSKRNKWSKVWIQEIFPIIFSERFQFEKYEEVARN
uniref:Uncharacterized protein n=1 Tax=Globisporangium ultimum (strain ATCC 200006 / CBS 805.95 / DAOM BR144) TaxID=431595 RepID=K3WYL8_GLOUD